MARKKSEVRILIVEDEFIISALLEQVLRDWGFENLATAHSLEEAFAAIRAQVPDFAFLDVMLGDRTSLDVADMLASKGIPFIFLSAVSDMALPEKWRKHQKLEKPVDFAALSKLCEKLIPYAH